MIDEQTVEDIQRAIQVIRKRGWAQGEFENSKGAVCLVGALKTAIYGEGHEWRIRDITFEKRNRFYDAYDLVYHVVNMKPEKFNDAEKTKRRHVLRALEEAQRQATKGT